MSVNSFFKIMFGFADVMFVAIFARDRVYACERGGFVVGPLTNITRRTKKRSIKTNDDRNALFYYMVELKHTLNFPKPP